MGLLHEKVHSCWVKSALLTPISRACTSPWAHLSAQRPQETAQMNLMWREGRDRAAHLQEQLPLTRRGCKILVTLVPKGCSRYSPSLNGTDGETEAQGQWICRSTHSRSVGAPVGLQHADKANLNAVLRIHRVYLTAVLADTYGEIGRAHV